MISSQNLFFEIENNNIDETQRLNACGVSLKCTDECGRTTFHFARSDEMIDFLCEVDPVACRDWKKEQDLIDACNGGDLDNAKRLVGSGVSVKCRDRRGMTPLHFAARSGHMNLAVWLLSSSASVSQKDECGRTPLHVAKSDEMRNFLREVDPAAYTNWEKEQDLMKACYRGDLDNAKRLVGSGVSVKCRDSKGKTPIHLAITEGRTDVAEWLHSSGASVHDKDEDRWTPTNYAVSGCHKEAAVWLLSLGASINDKDMFGWTPLHLAVNADHVEVTLWLLSSGAFVNCKDGDGYTALMVAARYSQLEGARLLMDAGADIDAQNRNGETALMIAIRYENKNVAQLLLERGAAGDEEQARAALGYARESGEREIGILLRKQLTWLSRRGFLMFLALQSYLPTAPPPLANSMSRDDLNCYYEHYYNPETRPNTAVHSVFFMEELQKYITKFLGPDISTCSDDDDDDDDDDNNDEEEGEDSDESSSCCEDDEEDD